MFDGISLSTQQESKVEKLESIIESKRQASPKHPRQEWMVQALNDEASDREILNDIKDRMEEQQQFRLSVAEGWIDVIDSLDDGQKEQFIENLQNLKQRKQQRREKRKNRQK